MNSLKREKIKEEGVITTKVTLNAIYYYSTKKQVKEKSSVMHRLRVLFNIVKNKTIITTKSNK